MTREGHDPLGDHARQNLAAHYRRLADAAVVAAADVGGGESDAAAHSHLAAVEDALSAVQGAHRSLLAVRRGRANGTSLLTSVYTDASFGAAR